MSSYLEFFGLRDEPFRNTFDNKYFVTTETNQLVLRKLEHLINTNKGLGVVTGNYGSGKTTLAKKIHAQFLKKSQRPVFISISQEEGVDALEFLKRVAKAFSAEGKTRSELLDSIFGRLTCINKLKRKAVLLIDEAQFLQNTDCLKDLRTLSNMEANGRKLLTIIFFGTYELEKSLQADPALYQRIAVRSRFGDIGRKTVTDYIERRITQAGGDMKIFTPFSLELIANLAKNSFRLVNTLCDSCLLQAYFSDKNTVNSDIVEDVAFDMNLSEIELDQDDFIDLDLSERYHDTALDAIHIN